MKILSKYLLKQNVFLMFLCLGASTVLYILTDLFDRLDDFVEAGVGFSSIITYFVSKTPLMISQTMPVVFLLAVVLQLSLMARGRELLALMAGGVSLGRVAFFFAFYSLVWCVIQLGFSQVLGVRGEQAASRIWKEEVRKSQMDKRTMENVWFREGPLVVKVDTVWPYRGEGRGLTVYRLRDDELGWTSIIQAQEFDPDSTGWELHNATVLDPVVFTYETDQELTLDLHQDLNSFAVIDPREDPAKLPLWQLSREIERLRVSGSNVEGLRATWHMKVAYAFSLCVMALAGLALVSLSLNVYLNVALSVGLAFAYYGLLVLGVSAGQKGLAPPAAGAWAGNFLFGVLALVRLLWYSRSRA